MVFQIRCVLYLLSAGDVVDCKRAKRGLFNGNYGEYDSTKLKDGFYMVIKYDNFVLARGAFYSFGCSKLILLT